MKLGIGTVQFGLDYGISNKTGMTPLDEARAILACAADRDFGVIDTAHGYGDSESVLGSLLHAGHGFRIITKTPAFPARPLRANDADTLRRSFRESLARLGQTSLAGLLVHSAADLLAPGGDLLYRALSECKASGGVDAIGASVYSGEQIDGLLERYELDIVQLPINLLDTRLQTSGRLEALRQRGIEVHARSLFLQGLLLMDPETIPGYFEPVRPLLRRYHAFLRENGLTAVEGAFCFITGVVGIDQVIIGVNHLDQLEVNARAFHRPYDQGTRDGLRAFAINDPRFVNPALWRLHAA